MADLLGSDPAAEFLQQEEDELRELGIDNSQFNEPATSEPLAFSTEFSAIPQQSEQMNGFGDAVTPEPHQPAPVILPVEEPETLVKWRQEKAEALKQQEEEEKEAQQAWNEKAKKELEDWYNRYNEQQEKVTNENKEAEAQFIEDMTDTKPGNEWEKVSRFCDFNPKFTKNTKDVSRMRGLLLQLKQTPLVR